MADRDIAVRFTGDSRDLERAADKAERSIADTGKGMGASLAGLAGPAAIAAAAVAGVALVGWDLASAAMEDEAAAAQLAQQLRQAAHASDEAVAGAEAYIEALSKTVAVADDELRPALATLATATGDTARAQDLLALATDISAGTGKDLQTVTQALAKAQLGSLGGLSKLGIATEGLDGKAMSLEETLAKAKETFAGAGEAAANTTAGPLKKAQIGFDEFKESIGAKLLPALGALASFFTDKVLPALEQVPAWVEANWGRVMAEIGPDLAELQATTAEVFADVQAFWAEWGDEVLAVVTTVIEVYIKWLITELKAFVVTVRWVVDQVKIFWAEYGDTILTVIRVVVETVNFMVTTIGYAMLIIQRVIAATSALLRGDWSAAWDAVRETTRLGVDYVIWLMGGWGERIRAALFGVTELIVAPFRSAFNSIADLWNRTIGSLSFEFPSWIPGMGGNRIDVPDIPRFQAFGASLTIVMPPGSDGYDVARQLATFERNVGPVGTAVAVR